MEKTENERAKITAKRNAIELEIQEVEKAIEDDTQLLALLFERDANGEDVDEQADSVRRRLLSLKFAQKALTRMVRAVK